MAKHPSKKVNVTNSKSLRQTSSRSNKTNKSTRKKNSKKASSNNTPMIIGGAIAAVIFFIFIIAAISGGRNAPSNSSKTYMSLSQKKQIYADYLIKCNQIESDAKAGLARLDAETRRRASKMTSKKVRNLKYAEMNKLQGRYEKKIRNLPKSYIEKQVIEQGRKNGW